MLWYNSSFRHISNALKGNNSSFILVMKSGVLELHNPNAFMFEMKILWLQIEMADCVKYQILIVVNLILGKYLNIFC
jgi:hypothetical protein